MPAHGKSVSSQSPRWIFPNSTKKTAVLLKGNAMSETSQFPIVYENASIPAPVSGWLPYPISSASLADSGTLGLRLHNDGENLSKCLYTIHRSSLAKHQPLAGFFSFMFAFFRSVFS